MSNNFFGINLHQYWGLWCLFRPPHLKHQVKRSFRHLDIHSRSTGCRYINFCFQTFSNRQTDKQMDSKFNIDCTIGHLGNKCNFMYALVHLSMLGHWS